MRLHLLTCVLVKEKSVVNKSMMASKNLPQAITNTLEGYHWIRVLAAELALRLRNARQTDPNLWPKTLVLHARKCDCDLFELFQLI
jgi:DNA polymerase eta